MVASDMCIPNAPPTPLLKINKILLVVWSLIGPPKNSTQIPIFIVYKAYVSATRTVFVPLVFSASRI